MSDGNEKKEGKPVSPDDIREMLKGLNVEEKERKAAEHRFWDTQPVAKLDEDVSEARGALEGPDKEVRQTPYALPEGFVWSDVDIDDDEQIGDAFTLLAKSYVEDDDGMFRFEYPVPFLRWALKPPGFRRDWHVGVRGAKKGNLLAFITAVPATIRVGEKSMKMVEINFLCVHKKLRSKRLAPVLIREITRRVNLTGVFQAVYTAGIELPKPWSKARYWHRSLNPRKLVDIGFSAPPRGRTTMRMLQARYRLPDETELPFVPYTPSDASEVAPMLEEYLNKFTVSPVLTADEVNHYFTPREGVVDSFVLREKPEKEGGTGPVIAFLSFYCLPSKILRHERHKVLKAAYCFYTCSPSIERYALLRTALILARQRDYDVFNALDIQDNDVKLLSELKFGIGDGNLHYYMYNYIHPEVLPGQCGLVLM